MGMSIYPPPGSIKSIQRGTTTGNVTVAAVDVSKSRLVNLGVASSTNNPQNASLQLTASTSIAYSAGSLTGTPSVSWELIEEY